LGVGFGVFFDAAQQWATLAGLLALLAAYPWALSLRFHSPAGFFVTCGDAHTVRRVPRARLFALIGDVCAGLWRPTRCAWTTTALRRRPTAAATCPGPSRWLTFSA
jgi:hypothetical protein